MDIIVKDNYFKILKIDQIHTKIRNVYFGTAVRIVGSSGVSAIGGSFISPHATLLHGIPEGRA